MEFDNHFDMSMHFLRVSEFVEADSNMFENCDFELVDYMDWYSHNMGDKSGSSFSYPGDWGGFNVPSRDLKKAYEDHVPKDWNRCDHLIYGIYKYLRCKEEAGDFYLISITRGDKETFDHEFAHAMWEISKDYKHEMVKAIDNLPLRIKNKAKKVLKEGLGYREAVHDNEIQAYFSTGLGDNFPPAHEKYRKEFIKIYKKYSKLLLTD